MTWVDAIVVLVLACSALMAFLRGFIREALGVCAWVGAVYVAITMFGAAQPEVRRMVQNPEIADPIAFGIVFLFALIGFSIIASLVGRMVRLSALSTLDRTIGLLFGVLRGALLVSGAYIGAGLVFATGMWPEAVLESRTLPYAYEGAQWIAAQMPSGYTPKVDPPPPAVATNSNDLMQSPPQGFALDGRKPPPSVDNPPPDPGTPGGN